MANDPFCGECEDDFKPCIRPCTYQLPSDDLANAARARARRRRLTIRIVKLIASVALGVALLWAASVFFAACVDSGIEWDEAAKARAIERIHGGRD